MSSLRGYLIEVAREYERVLSMYRVLMNLGAVCDSGKYVGVIEAALIESILAHSRSLIQFFKIVRGRRYKDVTYYLPYLKRGSAREFRRKVKACPGYEDAQRVIRDVNKYVLHLTRETAEPVIGPLWVETALQRSLGSSVASSPSSLIMLMRGWLVLMLLMSLGGLMVIALSIKVLVGCLRDEPCGD
ncbi:hypothetical protein [Vulcanisaeta sp. JCM 16161]|uniref:hypothetical protein n=1 Tax=Vulcanisaeta sp. JCM 16161 TaxID=1295372 RepID=UPI0006D15074|nr:hypothetical protein [Vulcanisaeta sp. JCM 16161]